MAKEVERALSSQKHEAHKIKERNAVLEGGIEESRIQIRTLEKNIELMQSELEDSKDRNTKYENGIYGLPQASAVRSE